MCRWKRGVGRAYATETKGANLCIVSVGGEEVGKPIEEFMYVIRCRFLVVGDMKERIRVVDIWGSRLSIAKPFVDVCEGFEDEFKPGGARHGGIGSVERGAEGLSSASKTIEGISCNVCFGEVVEREGCRNFVGDRCGVRNQFGHYLLSGERRERDARVREGEVGGVHDGRRMRKREGERGRPRR